MAGWYNRRSNQRQGDASEALAEDYLRRRGLTTCCRNYRCAMGEIDLIMRHGDALVFVEVRLRSNRRFGGGLESVTPSKQRRIIRAAKNYLLRQQLTDKVPCRFDVVALKDTNPETGVEWIQDAFQTNH